MATYSVEVNEVEVLAGVDAVSAMNRAAHEQGANPTALITVYEDDPEEGLAVFWANSPVS